MDQRNERLLGQTLQVLVEDVNNHDASMLTGRSEGNYLVHFKGPKELIGQTVPVKIDQQLTYYLVGTLQDKEEKFER